VCVHDRRHVRSFHATVGERLTGESVDMQNSAS
jgi:hypothetical protein